MRKILFLIPFIVVLCSITVMGALNDGIISCWTGDSTAVDYKNYNNASVNGGIGYSTTTKKLGSASFDMTAVTGDYLTVDSAKVPIYVVTYSFWVRFATVAGDEGIYLRGTPNDHEGLYYTQGGSNSINMWGSDDATGFLPATNTWYLVTETFSGSAGNYNRTVYYNGVANKSIIKSRTISTSTFGIGAYFSGGTSDLRGYMDEIVFWNRTLTYAEVTELYNSGTGYTCSELVNPQPSYSVNWEGLSPTNNAYNDNTTLLYYFNVSGSSTSNCSFYLNGTNILNKTNVGNYSLQNFTVTNSYNFVGNKSSYIGCTNNADGVKANSSTKYVFWNLTKTLSVNWNGQLPNNYATNTDATLRHYYNVTGIQLSTANCSLYWNGTIDSTTNNIPANTQSFFDVAKASPLLINATTYINCTSDQVGATVSSTKYILWNLTSPSVTLQSKTPIDITSINIISQTIRINYTYSNFMALQGSSIILFFKLNDSINSCVTYLNGSLYNCDWQTKNYQTNYSTGANGIYGWSLSDNVILPATYNIDENYTENTLHTSSDLSNNNNFYKVQLLNVSNSTRYGFFEAMFNLTTNVNQTINIYYCNSSYSSGTVTSSPNCGLFAQELIPNRYNHSHSIYSSHHVYPFVPVNGNISTVKISSTSYFLIQGSNLATVRVYNDPIEARTGVNQLTINNGVAWSNQAGVTLDAHLHQFNNDTTFYYYGQGRDLSDGIYYNSSIGFDRLDLGGLPPTQPIITNPLSDSYNKGIINITYILGSSPMGLNVNLSNITLLSDTGSFISTIVANNTNQAYYTWDSTTTTDGNRTISIRNCDSTNECSTEISGIFVIDNTKPSITIISPANDSYTQNKVIPITGTITDLYLNASTLFWSENNGLSNFSLVLTGDSFSITPSPQWVEGANNITIYARDSVRNQAYNSVLFYVDTVPPLNSYLPNTTTAGYKSQTWINLAVRANDSVALNSSKINLYNSLFALVDSVTSVNPVNAKNFTGLSDGTYYINSTAYDFSGYTNDTATRTIILDTTKPVITFTDPAVNFTYYDHQIFYITGTITDTNLDTLTLKYSNNSGLTNYSFGVVGNVFNISLFPNWVEGLNTVTIYAKDLANNTQSAIIQFYVDASPPTLTSVYPAEDNSSWKYITENSTFNLSCSNDGVNITSFGIFCYNNTNVVYNNTPVVNALSYTIYDNNNTISSYSDLKCQADCKSISGFYNVSETYSLFVLRPLTFENHTNLYNVNQVNDNFKFWINYTDMGADIAQCWAVTNISTVTCNASFGTMPLDIGCTVPLQTDANMSMNIFCNDTTQGINGIQSLNPHYMYVDVVDPSIVAVGWRENKTFFRQTINGSFTFRDNSSLFRWNVSIDGQTVDSAINVPYNHYIYNLSIDPSTLKSGYHSFFIEIADGHTANKIEPYNIQQGFFDKSYLGFETRNNKIMITAKEQKDTDRFIAKKENDRYSFTYTPDISKPRQDINLVEISAKEIEKIDNKGKKTKEIQPAKTYRKLEFVVETEEDIYIVERPESKLKRWLVSGNNWIDFDSNDADASMVNYYYDLSVNNKDRFKKVFVDVYYTESSLNRPIQFNSVGDLNIVNFTSQFYSINATATYTSPIGEGTPNTISVAMNLSGTSFLYWDINATINYNGTVQSSTKGIVTPIMTLSNLVQAPVTGGATTVSFYYNISFAGEPNYIWYFNQSVYFIGISSNCSQPNFTRALSVCGMRELNPSENVTDMHLNMNLDVLYSDYTTVIKSFGFAFDNSSCYDVCVNPNTTTYFVNGKLEYGDDGIYADRKYYIVNYSIDPTNPSLLLLYHIESENVSDISFTVYDKTTGDRIENAYIKILRYYPELSTSSTAGYKTVEVERTDVNGHTLGKMILADVWYKYIVEKPYGTVLLNSDIEKVISTTKLLPISSQSSNLLTFFAEQKISDELECNWDTYTCTYTWSTTDGRIVTGILRIYQNTGFSRLMVSEQSILSSGASLVYVFSNYTNKVYDVEAWIRE